MHLCSGCLEAASFLWGRHRLGSHCFLSASLVFNDFSVHPLSSHPNTHALVPSVYRFVFLLQYCLLPQLPVLFMVSTDSWFTVTANEND